MKATNKQVMEHKGLVYLEANRWRWAIGNNLDFEDLTQAGYLGVARAIETYDPDKGSFVGYAQQWIRHFIRRTCESGVRTVKVSLEAARKADKAGNRIPLYSDSLSPDSSDEEGGTVQPLDSIVVCEPDQDAAIEKAEMLQQLTQALSCLNDTQRRMVTLFHIKEYSRQQIADEFQVTEHTVKKTLQLAMEKMRQHMQEDNEEN